MKILDRKLLRDLWRMRGQVATIALVLASGIAAFVSIKGTHRALATSRDTYYTRSGFPDAFVHLERAPQAIAERLVAIPGVASVETRLVEPLVFQIPGMPRPASGRAISLGARDAGALRSVVLRAGRAPEPGRDDEVLLLETFARAHQIDPGDTVDVVLGGRGLRLRVVGHVLSPEWIFAIEAGVPSDRGFGVVWMSQAALAATAGKQGAFDDATFRLAPDANTADVVDAIDRVLAPWGGGGAYLRADQMSNRFLRGELDQLEVLATQVPAVFLLVAAFLLHVVLSRIVQLQREQIAVLRALGYTRAALARHVLGFALVVLVIGGLLGVGLGIWLAGALLGVYDQFFHFPVLALDLDAATALLAVGVAGGAAVVGALTAAGRAMRLSPADAMRPPAPARYRRGLLSRLGLARIAGPMGRMIVRDVERRPFATGLSIAGIAFAGAIVVLGRFSVDSMEYLMDVVFARTMREDMMVVLARPAPRSELGWFRGAPGVLAAEPMWTVPVRLDAGHRSYTTAISAWPRAGRLRQVLDGDADPVPLPPAGAMLTALLGERLGVQAGDRIEVTRLDGAHTRFELVVARLIDERMGMNVYMDLDALAAALGEEPKLGAVLLELARPERDRLVTALAEVPGVVMISEPQAFRDAFEKQSAEVMTIQSLIVVIFGSVIAIGVVYNTARITLSERSRDLATLRVLGFTRREVATVLIGQLAVQVLVSLPLGMLAGNLLASALMSQVDPEQYRFPTMVSPGTYAFASLIVIGSSLVTALVVTRRLDRIDLVSALKARD